MKHRTPTQLYRIARRPLPYRSTKFPLFRRVVLMRMFFILFLLALLTMLSILASCERTLDFKYKEIAPQLVVESNLTDNEIWAKLMLTTPMNEPLDTKLLTDAEVTVENLTTGQSTSLTPDDEGVFRALLGGIEGDEYRLSVTRGDQTHSSSMTMLAQSEIADFSQSWIKMPYDYVAILQVAIVDPLEYGNYYWVRLYRNGKFYKWNVIDDAASAEGILLTSFMTSRENLDKEDDEDALRPGDTVTVVVNAIDNRMFDYLTAISNDSSGPRLFSGEGCLGYFLASSPSSATLTFSSRQ